GRRRRHRLRRHHRGAARSISTVGRVHLRHPVRCSQGGRVFDAGGTGCADRHRARRAVGGRAAHRGTAARAVHLPAPAAGRAARRSNSRDRGLEGGDQVTTTAPASGQIVHEKALVRSWKAPIALAIFAILGLLMAFVYPNDGETMFTLSTTADAIQLPPLVVPTTVT